MGIGSGQDIGLFGGNVVNIPGGGFNFPVGGFAGPILGGAFGASRDFQNSFIDAAAPFITASPFDPGSILGGSVLDPGGRIPSGGGTGVLTAGGTGGGGGSTGGANIFGIPGTPSFGDILGSIFSGGGVDGNGNRGVLGDIGGVLGSVLGTIFGNGSGDPGSGGLLGQLLPLLLGGGGGGTIDSPNGSPLGGGGAGGLLNQLLPLLLLGGGLLGGNDSESRTRVQPPSPEELALLGINTQLAMSQLQQFGNQYANQAPQSQFLRDFFSQQQRQSDSFSGFLPPELRGLIEAGRRDRINEANLFEQPFQQGLQQDFARGINASPEQLANIQGSADAAISQGLSDLGRFRDEGLNRARLESANRGLRPSDTPIQNDFANIQQEANRSAENFVSGIRQQQFNQNLNFPLAAQGLRLGQFGAATDNSFRRRALEEELARLAEQQRVGIAGGAQSGGLGLLGAFNPISAQGAATNTRTGNSTQTNSPGTFDFLSQLFRGVGNVNTSQQSGGVFNPFSSSNILGNISTPRLTPGPVDSGVFNFDPFGPVNG